VLYIIYICVCVWPINCYRLMPYLLICRARPKMLARLLLEQMRASLGWGWWSCRTAIHCGSWNTWKTAKYMSNIFFTMRISHDCFCNGQPGRLAFTGSVLLVCKYSHAIMHKRLRLRRTSFRQSCIPVRHYRLVAFWRLYFRSNTPSWNPWKNIRTGHVAVDDFGRQQ